MSKDGTILEKLMEISERIAVVETKVDRVSEDMSEVKAQDEIQNRLLAEHIAGVETARQMIALEKEKRISEVADLDSRLQVIETPKKIISGLKTALLWIGGIAGAVVSIAKFVGLF